MKEKIKLFDPLLKGSPFTILNHFFLGVGNIAHKQFIKGLIYLCLEILFVLIMFVNPTVNGVPIGAKALGNLASLGTFPGDAYFNGPVLIVIQADNSQLMILFGVLTIGLIAGFILLYISAQRSSYLGDIEIRNGKKPTTFLQDLQSLLGDRFHVTLLVPALIGIVVFTVLPTLYMILIAFTNYDSSHLQGSLIDWVGFDNFIAVFQGKNSFAEIHELFLPILLWTFVWAIFATVLNYFLGIMVAILINNKNVRFKGLWRTILILTIAIPQFISLLSIRFLTSKYGPLGEFLQHIGIAQNGLFSNDSNVHVVRAAIIIVNMWIGIPYTMLMTSGILMNIPQDLYEAAEIDGASKFVMFRKITFPYILFITTPYLIQSFIGNITSFNVIYLLSNGVPNFKGYSTVGQTDLLVTWLYKLTMSDQNYNLAAVIGIFTFLITASITLITYRHSKAYKEEDTFQ